MTNSLYHCTPRQARKFIIDCIQAGLVPFLQSSPGIGKSSITRSIAKDFNLHLIDHRLSTSEPTDLTGMPRVNENGESYYAPFSRVFPTEDRKIPKGKDGWLLFLDEFNSAPRSVQAAAYKLILDRMVGEYRLHDNVALVTAGNLMSDRAIVNPLSTAMQSRVIHLEMVVSFEEWLEDVALKENYDSRIIAFLMQFPGKLMDFRPDHHDRTFCCPRTWEFANRLIQGKNLAGKAIDDMAILLAGTITSGVAMEFVQFTKVYDQLVTIKEIVSNPKECRLPVETTLKWATVSHMMEKIDAKIFKPLATYIDRFDLSFKILFYRSILVRKPELRTHPDFGPAVGSIISYLHDSPYAKGA